VRLENWNGYFVNGFNNFVYYKAYTDCSNGGALACKTQSISTGTTYLTQLTGFTPGTTYYLRLTTHVTITDADFQICLLNPPAITNDECANAIPVTPQPEALACSAPTVGYTLGATDSGVGCPSNADTDDDVWFEFTAATSAQIISFEDIVYFNEASSSLGLDVGLFENCGSSLGCYYGVANGLRNNKVHFDCLTPGTTYRLKISTPSTSRRASFRFCIINTTTPANDECSGAIELIGQPFSSACVAPISGTTVGAAVNDQCGLPDVWYSFTASATSEIIQVQNTIPLFSNTAGAFGTLYDACNGSIISNLSLSTSTPTVFSGLTIGHLYFLKVRAGGSMNGTAASFDICLIHPPTNDECSSAQTLPVSAGPTCNSQTPGMTNAATSSLSASPCSGIANDDVWFSFVATACTHDITVASTSGRDFVVELRSGPCNGANLICEDNYPSGGTETLKANFLTVGATYYIRVWSFEDGSFYRGTFNICVTTPALMTYSSSSVAQTGTAVAAGAQNADVLRLQIQFSGSGCPLTVSQIRVNTTGTTNNAAILSARIYFTAEVNTLNVSNPVTQLFGTAIVNPGTGTLTFNGSQTLDPLFASFNYFWLVYDVSPCATGGNVLDGQWVDFSFSSVVNPIVPSTNNPAGSRSITAVSSFTSVADGNWSSPAVWGGCVPSAGIGQITINSNVTLDANFAYPSANLTINAGKSLTINTHTLTIGPAGGGNRAILCTGSLTIGDNGRLDVNGRLQFLSNASFTMNSGELNIDGNTGSVGTSVANNLVLLFFGVPTQANPLTVQVSGGTITIVDPPITDNTFAFGINASSANPQPMSFEGATIRFGDGISSQAGGFFGFAIAPYAGSKNVPLGNTIINGGSGTNRFASARSKGVHILGNFTVNTNSEFRNVSDGILAVCGNIVNNGIVSLVGSGSRLILGSSETGGAPACSTPQTISGSGIWRNDLTTSTASVRGLTVQNSGGITLEIPFSTNELTLTQGNVYTTAVNYLAVGQGILPAGTLISGFVFGGSNTSKIVGPFKMTSNGVVDRIFPVGTDALWRRAIVQFNVAPTSHGVLTAEFKTGPPSPAGLPITDGGIQITGISPTGFWEISKDANLSGGQYTVTVDASGFTKMDGSAITGPTDIRLIKRPSGGAWTSGTDGTSTINFPLSEMNRSGCNAFSEFAIGGTPTSMGTALPVELLDFSAKTLEKTVRLDWTTATETNNKGFFIERSADGERWQSLGFVAGQGNSIASVSYSFLDEKPLPGINYYRLLQVDFDGRETFSAIVPVTLEDRPGKLSIYPNPVTAGSECLITYPFSDDEATASLRILDAIGRQVAISNDAKRLIINDLQPGVYWLEVRSDMGYSIGKLVVQ